MRTDSGSASVEETDRTAPLPDRPAFDLVDALRGQIASQELPPGARLREQELSEEFGVPRTKVREALSALDARGLIDRIPNKGAVVARLGIDRLVHIYDVREVLEGLCARLAAERAPTGAWEPLVEFFGAPMQAHVDAQDFAGFLDGYERFRNEMTTAAGNPVLSDMLDVIYDITQVAIRRTIILPGRAEVGLAEHRAVLTALADGNGELAEELRRENMRSAKAFLVRFQNFVV